jgi:hypothetical protein
MHLFLVRFVTVRLAYICIDYPDCEYIIMLNMSIVIYDFCACQFCEAHPFNAHIWKLPSRKSLRPPVFQYQLFVVHVLHGIVIINLN